MIKKSFFRLLKFRKSLRIPFVQLQVERGFSISKKRNFDEVEEEFKVFRRLSETEFFMKDIFDFQKKGDIDLEELSLEYKIPERNRRYKRKIVTKKPSDSFVRIVLNLSNDEKLRVSYLKSMQDQKIRIGRLLEDLDSTAAEISYRHCDGLDPDQPLTIVTASLNTLTLEKEIDSKKDIVLEGFPVFVGTSSLRVYLRVVQELDNENTVTVMESFFTMVAKDWRNQKSVKVNRISPETEEEKMLYKKAEKMGKISLERSLQSEEMFVLHDLFTSKKNEKHVTPSQTEMTLIRTMYPQRKNIHGKVFGGYLLRRSTELAWICACSFVDHMEVRFCSLYENVFILPVEIGSLVRFKSHVVYVEDEYIQVRVELSKINLDFKVDSVSNIFYLTFVNERGANDQKNLIPNTYEEGILYLEGRDIFLKNKN